MVDDAHHGTHALLERTQRAVRLQFVVLDEIDAARTQHIHKLGRLLGREADRGLDDRADQRPSVHPSKLAGAVDAEFGAGISARKGVWQPNIENAQTRELFEFEQIAGDSRHQVGQ